jgi:hypothetical protein
MYNHVHTSLTERVPHIEHTRSPLQGAWVATLAVPSPLGFVVISALHIQHVDATMRIGIELVITMLCCSVTFGQNIITAVQPPVAITMDNHAIYEALIASPNPLLTEQTINVGAGTTAVGKGAVYLDTELGTGACSPTINYSSAEYYPGGLDAIVAAYKTSFIFQVAAEGNTNNITSDCVWSQAQANASALTWAANTRYLPGEYICEGSSCPTSGYWQIQSGCYSGSGYSNTCMSGSSKPSFTGDGPIGDDQVTWIKIDSAPLQDGYCGVVHTCISPGDNSSCYARNGNAAIIINANSLGPCTLGELYQSEPVGYELPVRNWENKILSSFISHYNGNTNVDYMRVGSPGGGEFGINIDFIPIAPWGNGDSDPAQFRAQWISWVNKLDAQIMSYKPTFRIFSNINCVGPDCSYSDQEAIAAYDHGFSGIGNEDANINDMNDLGLTGTTGSYPCKFPLVAVSPGKSACTEGDWAYNFSAFPTMAHELQSLMTGTTPIYCEISSPMIAAGPLALLPTGSAYCPKGTIGIIQSIINLCTLGAGSPNQKICVNVLEMHTGNSTGNAPIIPANDTLLALSGSNYAHTEGYVADYASHQAAYKKSFCLYLGLSNCANLK